MRSTSCTIWIPTKNFSIWWWRFSLVCWCTLFGSTLLGCPEIFCMLRFKLNCNVELKLTLVIHCNLLWFGCFISIWNVRVFSPLCNNDEVVTSLFFKNQGKYKYCLTIQAVRYKKRGYSLLSNVNFFYLYFIILWLNVAQKSIMLNHGMFKNIFCSDCNYAIKLKWCVSNCCIPIRSKWLYSSLSHTQKNNSPFNTIKYISQ